MLKRTSPVATSNTVITVNPQILALPENAENLQCFPYFQELNNTCFVNLREHSELPAGKHNCAKRVVLITAHWKLFLENSFEIKK